MSDHPEPARTSRPKKSPIGFIRRIRGAGVPVSRVGPHDDRSAGVSAAERTEAQTFLRRLLAENARIVEDAHERMQQLRRSGT